MVLRVVVWGLLYLTAVGAAAAGASLTYVVTVVPGAQTVHVAATIEGSRSNFATLALRSEATYVESYITNMHCGSTSATDTGQGRWSVSGTTSPLAYEYDIARIVPWDPNVPWGTDSDIGVYVDGQCALFMAPYLFVYPDRLDLSSIRVKFVVPQNWSIVTPYSFDGEFHVAQKVTKSLLDDFLGRQQIYMGPMRFYAERNAGTCVVKFGQLLGDDNTWDIGSQADVDAFADATAAAVLALSGMFGAVPYDTFAMYTNFRRGNWAFQGTRYFGNGYQYWPKGRWDELVGHAAYAWASDWYAPLLVEYTLAKGVIESYYGQLLAWELFQDPTYCAKMYRNFLMYEWMYNHHARPSTSYTGERDEYDAYFRWEFIALLLDQQIRASSGNGKTLEDAMRWLYAKYVNSGHRVSASDLQQAIRSSTGVDLSGAFSKYVSGQAKLPVYEYLADYRQYLAPYVRVFERTKYHNYPCGHVVPLFVDMVLSAALGEHLAWALGGEAHAIDFAERILTEYKLNALTESDVTRTLSAMTKHDCSDFFTYWEGSYGRLTLAEVTAWLKDYVYIRGRAH